MQVASSSSSVERASALALGYNHGYRLEGDRAILSAELAIDGARIDGSRSWALQLWACDAPYEGGRLQGIKVAEAALELMPGESSPAKLEAEAFARVPPGRRDYAMVLVLASGRAGACDQVHDFSNYPERAQFIGPHLDGSVGYRVDGDAVVLSAERIGNARAEDNLSGTLSLALWALPAPYAGEPLETLPGALQLAEAVVGRVHGQRCESAVERRVALAQARPGSWRVALVLREWTLAGYVTRDYCNFAASYDVAAPREQPVVLPPAPPRDDGPARVSIQRASVEELAHVTGLNKKLAQAIVRARPYTSLAELRRVRGIGDKMLLQLRRHLTV